MPEQSFDVPPADKVLESLEDYTLTTYQSRCSNYQTIQGILERENNIDNDVVKRLLAVCVHDLKEDMKYAVNTLNVITVILGKVKVGECQCLAELSTAALAILSIIKTTALISKVQTLQMLCFDTFLSFPDETHCDLGSAHSSEVMEVFNLYFHQGIPMGIKLMPFNILFKMLKTLPPDKRTAFVKEGLNIWFAKVIPTTMAVVVTTNSMVPKILETLELLTEELVGLDYANNTHWQTVVDNLYTAQKYPATIKTLLENNNANWCRLWSVFVKLLKRQLTTMNKTKTASPINLMLPVVEMAFKMDYTRRTQAYQCWNVLIDNFATEKNEVFLVKTIKLLMIPLKTNNAKVEDLALVKFNTWWHLIRKFEQKLNKLFDMVFIPFLHFCFGNHLHGADTNIMVPGLAFPKVSMRCVQAFVEISGHANCDGCTTKKLPKLGDKILEPKVLLDFLPDWVYSLKMFTKMLCSDKCICEKKDRYLRCVWGSFMSVASEMGEDGRYIAYGELLALMTQLSQESNNSSNTAETVFNIIASHMPAGRRAWARLMQGSEAGEAPPTGSLHKTLRLLLAPALQNFYNGSDPKTSVAKLRQLTDLLINDSKIHNELIDWLLLELTPNDNTLVFWSALMEAVVEGKSDISVLNMKNLLLWPLRNSDCFGNAQHAASVWNSSYEKLKNKLKGSIEKDISMLLLTCKDTSTNQLALYALLQIIKDLLASDNSTEWKIEAELLVSILAKVKDHKKVEAAFPVIIESLMMMMKRLGEDKNASLAEYTLTAVNTTLRLLLESAKSSGPNNELNENIEKLLVQLNEQFKTELCIKFKFLLIEQLISCASTFDKHQAIKDTVSSILKTFIKKSKPTEMPFYSVVTDAIASIEKPVITTDLKFTTPKTVKKTKKKEPKIVNKVVENGEEYVVVESNWKFNPRKLTEHQKEKLQRKREDIPALYQDLSQSQDEFKLRKWKPADSQDTSTSNSASQSNSKTIDATDVLKTFASSEVVPKIMENIFSEIRTDPEKDKVTNENTKKTKKPTPITPKQVKSPRIALKDRVFQNVRNLIEKSNLKEVDPPIELNKTLSDPGPKTPTSKPVNEVTATYSAPPKISSERPCRAKRKPKKYELDFLEMNKKKRRNSLSNDKSDSQNLEVNSPNSLDNDAMEISDEAPKVQDNEPIEVTETPEVNNEVPMETDATQEKTKDKLIENNAKVTEPQPQSEIEESTKTKTEETKLVEPEVAKLDTAIPDKDSQTPSAIKTELVKAKSSNKKGPKKSRIVKELAIDMVEGHPYLNVEDKRSTRKNNTPVSSRRKALCDKLNKPSPKIEAKTPKKMVKTCEEKDEDKEVSVKELSIVVKETQDGLSTSSADDPMSEDFIESSQDSTLTTISVKSTKSMTKKSPKILDKLNGDGFWKSRRTETQNMLIEPANDTILNDIEFSKNKANDTTQLTADFDTQPVDENKIMCSDDVIIINDEPEPIVINTESASVHSDTLEIANADTEPIDPNMTQKLLNRPESIETCNEKDTTEIEKASETANDTTVTLQSGEISQDPAHGLSSPTKDDDEQRNQDFLNNTLEISPIKAMSPITAEATSPNNSNDFVVIKLSSPVQSNGEPFEKSGSPEVFTEDKVSPDKRDQSPPREEINANNSSPSSSLSLKKNRPQVRRPQSGGRAAQMLGLCVPDNLIMNSERVPEVEETKKTPITPARRNLRILYNCENNETDDSEEASESFLKFKRALPTAECSPSGPILKRKLADIADEATISPASKRKRVSFHDPPVSTTVSVQKYIEPLGVRSPQSSNIKRAPRQGNMKSPKKLETIFKLDTALTKTVESFVDLTYNSDDMSSLDPTLSVEVVKNDELDDTEPICLALINCTDKIMNIAAELSSPTMKELLVKELEGKIETIGDLAKLTELEVNRLCIKAPKIKTAKRVLNEYKEKMLIASQDFGVIEQTIEAQIHEITEADKVSEIIEKEIKDSDVQTDTIALIDVEAQTNEVKLGSIHTQTDVTCTTDCCAQTDEVKTTWDMVKSYVSEDPKIGETLADTLKMSAKEQIAQTLPVKALARVVNTKSYSQSKANDLLDKIIDNTKDVPKIDFMKEYIMHKLSNKEVLLLCSELIRKIHDNPT